MQGFASSQTVLPSPIPPDQSLVVFVQSKNYVYGGLQQGPAMPVGADQNSWGYAPAQMDTGGNLGPCGRWNAAWQRRASSRDGRGSRWAHLGGAARGCRAGREHQPLVVACEQRGDARGRHQTAPCFQYRRGTCPWPGGAKR